MLASIVHVLKVVHSVVREHAKKITRSSKWASVRKAAIQLNPKCACCGSTNFLQVHHMQPFHLKPELELTPKNLIVLCMGKNECHLLIGHGNNFKKYNPYIGADSKNLAAGSITKAAAAALAKKNAIFLPINIKD